MPDFTLSAPDFTATTITVTAATDKGRELMAQVFGIGAREAVMPKTSGMDFVEFVQRKGLTVL